MLSKGVDCTVDINNDLELIAYLEKHGLSPVRIKDFKKFLAFTDQHRDWFNKEFEEQQKFDRDNGVRRETSWGRNRTSDKRFIKVAETYVKKCNGNFAKLDYKIFMPWRILKFGGAKSERGLNKSSKVDVKIVKNQPQSEIEWMKEAIENSMAKELGISVKKAKKVVARMTKLTPDFDRKYITDCLDCSCHDHK